MHLLFVQVPRRKFLKEILWLEFLPIKCTNVRSYLARLIRFDKVDRLLPSFPRLSPAEGILWRAIPYIRQVCSNAL